MRRLRWLATLRGLAAERTPVLMCACSHSFTCARCAGTPFDPAYMDSDPEPVSEEAFAELAHEPSFGPPLMFGEQDG